MTYKEIYDALYTTGLPVTVNFWEKDIPPMPYIVIEYPGSVDFMADDSNYVNIETVEIALYTKRKSTATEATVEAVLAEYFETYLKNSQWVQADHVQETIYSTEVIINGE